MWGLKRRGGQGFALHGSAESLVIAVMIVIAVAGVAGGLLYIFGGAG